MQDSIITDGHAHIYSDGIAEKIISSFTDFYKMNPTATGRGTRSMLLKT